MDLDKMKNIWKEQKTASFSREEILNMLKKRSSSTAKWIFYISLGEFIFWIILNLTLPDSNIPEFSDEFLHFSEILNIIHYTLIIGFIILFFINYKAIKVEQTVNKLLKNIFNLRRTVKYYIIYNLSIAVLGSIILFIWLINNNPKSFNIPENIKYPTVFTGGLILGILVFILILLLILYFFYRLLYGFLLNRLQKNYDEIKELE